MKEDWKSFFKDKKITVMGLGLLGRGIGDVRFLAEQGAELIVTDLKTESELKHSLEELSDFPNITFHLGEHRIEDFEDRDMIIKASGVPLDSPYIKHAEKNGIPVYMSVALFAKFCRMPIVGVTGTLGKTTTTHLIDHILRHAGFKTILGGNVQGVSTLEKLPDAASVSVATPSAAVLELDSWTLQGFTSEDTAPEVAVFTAFLPDHMNYYHGDMDQYFADKANIFLHQTPEDTLVVTEPVAELIHKKYPQDVQSKAVVAKEKDILKSWKLRIPGVHNRLNAACALHAVRALGVDDAVAKEAIESFEGVSGRLAFVAEKNGIKWYNDTAATTPSAGASGVEALDQNGAKTVIVIAGGSDKTLDPSPFAEALKAHAKKIIVLPGNGTDLLRPLLPEFEEAATLEEAVQKATAAATEGDSVTLTPGFASFGMFKNMYDRGAQFEKLVGDI